MIEPQELAIEEFGPYLVYERLGVGGMATVHRALERGIEGFERVVALKRLLPHLAEDASFIKSFVREAKLASTLQHANIVQTLELGRVGPTYFISMEYIDGRDIRRILRHARKVSGPPPINVTLALMLQLCDALDYAHNRCDANDQPLGLVHRDLSPSNLLLTRSGHLKVIDFGIAKAQSAALATQTGRVKGKLAYMAPESIAGKELDARSDLFAAGVVFHELLTARPLFAQKNEYQTLLKVQRGDVAAPSTFNEGVPKELDDIVLKALARDPEDRWADAAALRDALVTVRMARQLSATPRDVTTWCDWAFSLEMGGFSGKTFTEGLVSGGGFGNTASPLTRTPLPMRARPPSKPNQDEEAAAEIAWGASEQEGRGVPHIHDEVPDVSNKIVGPSALAAAAVDVGLSESSTDESPTFDPALMESAASTQPDMQASTIKTLAVPPPRSELRPAAFPAGSSDDALRRARPRTITIPPKAPSVTAAGTSPPTLRGPAPSSRPPPIPSAATARGSTTNLLEDLEGPPPTPPHMVRDAPTGRRPSVAVARPTTPTEVPTIGASIAARETHNLRNAIIALVVLGAAATAITLAVIGRGDDVTVAKEPAPQGVPMRTTGTVKFVIEPADAEIKLSTGAPHTGSPWQTELAAGLHQVEIHRDGYKSWLTSVELSAGETQTLRVVLEQVVGAGGPTAATTATLIVDPSIPGLEVVLDGVLLDGRTPLRTEVKPGKHELVLRQDGVEAWSQDFTAVANATHSFDPSMSDDKKRERNKRRRDHLAAADDDDDSSRWTRPDPVKPPANPTTTPTIPTTPPPANPTLGTSVPAPVKPAPTPVKPAPTPTPPPTIVKPAPTPTPPTPAIVKPTPPPTPTPAPTKGPVLIPPSKVTRTSGSVPELQAKGSSLASEALPKQISAKVCIDTTGAVSSANVLSKVPAEVKKTLEVAIRGWRYSQYKENGIALSACFVASFRSK